MKWMMVANHLATALPSEHSSFFVLYIFHSRRDLYKKNIHVGKEITEKYKGQVIINRVIQCRTILVLKSCINTIKLGHNLKA